MGASDDVFVWRRKGKVDRTSIAPATNRRSPDGDGGVCGVVTEAVGSAAQRRAGGLGGGGG